jgi:hypothetical protein
MDSVELSSESKIYFHVSRFLGAFKLNQHFSINGGEMSEVSDSFNAFL